MDRSIYRRIGAHTDVLKNIQMYIYRCMEAYTDV
jgi:hypothetical protein